MSIAATYDLFAGILLLVEAVFIGVPAWSRWTRNLKLVRKGRKTTGRYQGKGLVTFVTTPDKRQITFATWRRTVYFTNLGDELPVIYDPANPNLAEVMTHQALWNEPMGNFLSAAMLVVTSIMLFRGINITLALCLSFFVFLFSYPLGKFILYGLYPASRLKARKRDRLQSELAEQETEPYEPSPGPGKSYSRRQRRWKRQQDWKEHVPEAEGNVSTLVPEIVPSPSRVKIKARDQLLLDMLSVDNALEEPPLSDEK